jgi:hypothetical protein
MDKPFHHCEISYTSIYIRQHNYQFIPNQLTDFLIHHSKRGTIDIMTITRVISSSQVSIFISAACNGVGSCTKFSTSSSCAKKAQEEEESGSGGSWIDRRV